MSLLRDLAEALLAPQRFFAALAGRPASASRAFLALLLPFAVAGLALMAQTGRLLAGPELAQILADGRIAPEVLSTALLAAAVLLGPVLALLTWLAGWLPIRLGAGRFPRIGEIAAWTQLPTAVSALVAMPLAAGGLVAAGPATLVMQIGPALWCGWLVFTALRVFSPRTAVSGIVVYGLFTGTSLALSALSTYLGPQGGTGGTLVF